MAIADDYAEWIVKNADRKGTPEFNTVAAAYADAMKGMQSTASSAEVGSPDYSEKVGFGQAALIGAGRSLDKTIAGIRQLFTTDPKAKAALESEQAGNDKVYSVLQNEHPFATSMGEALPYIAIPSSAGIPAAVAGVSALEGLKYGSPQQRLQNSVLGGASTLVGGLGGQMVARAINPVSEGALTASKSAAMEGAKNIGVKPRLSEITGIPFASRLEDFAARTPGGAGVMENFAQGNRAAINTAAARSIGEKANEMTPEVFSNAASRLGKVFEDIKSLPGRVITLDKGVSDAADNILRQQSKMIPKQQDADLIALARQAKALANANGRIDGESYQLLRSGLSESSYDASGTTKAHYGQLLNAIDDSAQTSLRKIGQEQLADDLLTVRPQYSNLKTLEKGLVSEGGNVSPARVAQVLRQNNPGAYREGKLIGNPLFDIARYGENFKPLQQGSQTFERGLMASPTAAAVASPFAYLAAKLTTSPVALAYPQYIGGTAAAKGAAQIASPTARALAAQLLRNSVVPGSVPVMSEQQ